MRGQPHAPAASPLRYLLNRGGGGPEPVLTLREEINILPIPEFEPRIIQAEANMTKMEGKTKICIPLSYSE
jgi:hypothetical protein